MGLQINIGGGQYVKVGQTQVNMIDSFKYVERGLTLSDHAYLMLNANINGMITFNEEV